MHHVLIPEPTIHSQASQSTPCLLFIASFALLQLIDSMSPPIYLIIPINSIKSMPLDPNIPKPPSFLPIIIIIMIISIKIIMIFNTFIYFYDNHHDHYLCYCRCLLPIMLSCSHIYHLYQLFCTHHYHSSSQYHFQHLRKR